MTDDQREAIFQLRMQGWGYKAIALQLQLTRDNVRSYCQRNGLQGHGAVVPLNQRVHLKKQNICRYCEGEIIQPHKGRRRSFCSTDCRRRWWTENQDQRRPSQDKVYPYRCDHCGKAFTAYADRERKYCSHRCYTQSRFWRDEDGV